jgi:predicted  nucleic acid-binding Zn-ribbon protein
MKKRIKAHIRKKCRKCGTLLVNKPEYGAVCPKCGWCRGWYTDKDKVEGAIVSRRVNEEKDCDIAFKIIKKEEE